MRISSVGRRSEEARGVTLLEMLVVVALIGTLAAISFPSVSSGLDSVRIASSSDDVATFLNSAVNRAERRQVPVEVLISTRERRLTMRSTEAGFGRVLQLPDGILLEAVLPPVENEQPGEPRRLIVMPGATVPGVGVELANRHGAHRIIRLDPMTGFPRVESVVTK
jgi:prepilin-type N-terminal cleavage/methylation domain-containing protein